jgi:hypothetical protein
MDGDDEVRLLGGLAREEEALQISAREQPNGCVGRGADSKGGEETLREAPRLAPVDEDVPGDRRATVRLEHGVLRGGHAPDQALSEPVLGDVTDARVDGGARVRVAEVAAADGHAAARERPQAGHDLGQLALAVPGDAGDPEDLPRSHLERDVDEAGEAAVVERRDVLEPQHGVAGGADGGRRLEHDVATDHHARERARVRLARHRLPDLAPGPKDGDPVRDGEHLVQLVGDEDDCLSLSGHLSQEHEEVPGLLGGEDGGRLVEDEDASPAVDRLHDLDALLLADGELPDPRLGMNGKPMRLRELRDLADPRARRQPEARPVPAEEDVLGHGERLDEAEVLVDHPDTGVDRLTRRAE